MNNDEQKLKNQLSTEAKSIYELFETDTTMEQQGILLDFGPYGRFKIARASSSNIRFSESTKKRNRPYEKMLRQGAMPEELGEQILANIYADSIILEWEGVIGRDKKPIPYTHENVVKLLHDLPDLFRQIIIESQNADLYRKEFVEEALKN